MSIHATSHLFICPALQLVTRLASDTSTTTLPTASKDTRRRWQSGKQCSSTKWSRKGSKDDHNNIFDQSALVTIGGGVAQMVERSLSMREVPGSIPGASTDIFMNLNLPNSQKSGKHSAHVFFFAVCSRAQNLESGNFPLLRRISLLKWVQGSSHLEIRTSLHEVAWKPCMWLEGARRWDSHNLWSSTLKFTLIMYRGEKKGLQSFLSYRQAGPGRKSKQGHGEISRNHVQTFFSRLCMNVRTRSYAHPIASCHEVEGERGEAPRA